MTVITRFAPSPTGNLHVGNARIALINWLYAKKYDGKFFLRFDDSDRLRNNEEYKNTIKEDLTWLHLNWDIEFNQSDKIDRYLEIVDLLIKDGLVYACFETEKELENQRKLLLEQGKPPIYDRYSKTLTKKKISDYLKDGRKPYYRFFLNNQKVVWHDIIKGEMEYFVQNLSDPVILRNDRTVTYMLSSCVDDIDCGITHILRGEDHISNTAIQIQIFSAINAYYKPQFGHIGLIKSFNNKVSKRSGGFEISGLRKKLGIEFMTLNSFLSFVGSSLSIEPKKTLSEIIKIFEIDNLSKGQVNYSQNEIINLNHKMILQFEYEDVIDRINDLNIQYSIDKQFWNTIKSNIYSLYEIKDWVDIIYHHKVVDGINNQILKIAIEILKNLDFVESIWIDWINSICCNTNIIKKEIISTLRLAITGLKFGPEMSKIIILLGKQEIINRLSRYII